MKVNKSSKTCALCKRGELDELDYGLLKCTRGVKAHYYCLLFSETITQSGKDYQGILGFLDSDILAELRRAKKRKCAYCNKFGATAGCANKFCQTKFHLPCGRENSTQQDFESFNSYCCKHGKQSNVPSRIRRTITNYKCVICLDSLEVKDRNDSIWADCCKADIVLHSKCIKKLALSAGYFTKCPGCNNRADFIKTIKLYGVFVPERDASWELASNAFAELYHVHDGCDAKQCHCPQGRRHYTERGKWKYFLCNLCGSSGTHQYCSQVKREFVCDICSLAESTETRETVEVSVDNFCDVNFSTPFIKQEIVYDDVNVEPRFDVASDDDEIIIVDSDEEECGPSANPPESLDILNRLSKEIKINTVAPSTSTSSRQVALKSTTKCVTRPTMMATYQEELVPYKVENEFKSNEPKEIEASKIDRTDTNRLQKTNYNKTVNPPEKIEESGSSQEIIVIDSDEEVGTALVDNFSCELFEPVAKVVKYDDADIIPRRSFIRNQPSRQKNVAVKSTTSSPSLKRKRWMDGSESCQKENMFKEGCFSSNFRQKDNIRYPQDYDKTKLCSNEEDYISELNDIPINNLEYGSDENSQGSFIQYNVPVDIDGEIEFVHSPKMSVRAQDACQEQ